MEHSAKWTWHQSAAPSMGQNFWVGQIWGPRSTLYNRLRHFLQQQWRLCKLNCYEWPTDAGKNLIGWHLIPEFTKGRCCNVGLYLLLYTCIIQPTSNEHRPIGKLLGRPNAVWPTQPKFWAQPAHPTVPPWPRVWQFSRPTFFSCWTSEPLHHCNRHRSCCGRGLGRAACCCSQPASMRFISCWDMLSVDRHLLRPWPEHLFPPCFTTRWRQKTSPFFTGTTYSMKSQSWVKVDIKQLK